MLNKIIWRSMFVLVLMLSLVACRKRASDEIDFGTITNSVYHNQYFGLNMTLPTNWSVQDQKTQQRMMKKGVEYMAGDDKDMKNLLKASELQTVNLFAAFKHPVGTPVDYNPNILSIAEMVRDFPGIKRGKDYLIQSRKLLEAGQLRMKFPTDYYTEKLGGREFDVMDVEVTVLSKLVKQKYYSFVDKGYALGFIISFTTEAEAAELQKILDTIKFDAPNPTPQ